MAGWVVAGLAVTAVPVPLSLRLAAAEGEVAKPAVEPPIASEAAAAKPEAAAAGSAGDQKPESGKPAVGESAVKEPAPGKAATGKVKPGKEKEPPLPSDPMAFWTGLWIQQDSGGVMEFRSDGTVAGLPVSGKFQLLDTDWIHLTSGGEVLKCRWKNRSDDVVHLQRFIEGRPDTIELLRLRPVPLNLRKFEPKCVIRHLVVGEKRASDRSVLVDPKTGHFRTAEGGFYLRLTEGPNGSVLGYAPGLDTQTTEVKLFGAGRYLVAFDRLEKPRLFASCLFVE